ncbi:outer membrane lipoprotein carrier protein LolA [Shewanella sp. WXL01]|uniref:outer membrane lipoprotein carrier protein LolA n=1 Tax=Shewanella sp. WXL01 TaxID=2709721 RepID=UPI0014386805|nr:outer membrane lipoprotein carrier protein LolA [Shewanella sp. WXL01]NKF49963.1 outer membrane lipoprotein carrier protein LolA [Shewanella sp. WXL01]
MKLRFAKNWLPLPRYLAATLICLTSICSLPNAVASTEALNIDSLAAMFNETSPTHGSFEQQKNMSVLTLPLNSNGVYFVDPGKTIVWQQLQPFTQTTLIQNGELTQLVNGEVQPSNQAAASDMVSEMIMALFSGNWQQLTQDFAFKISGDKSNWQAELTPTSGAMAKVFKAIYIQGLDTHIRRISLHEHSGDSTNISLEADDASELPASIERVLKLAAH